MSEREQFETAYRQEFGKRWVCPQRQDMFKRETNRYAHLSVQDMWVMWQAARAQPAQAEVVPSYVVRDAERYRWLRNESWAGYNTGKGTPSVYTVDGAGNRRMMLAEEAMDDAIDAAIAQQKGTTP